MQKIQFKEEQKKEIISLYTNGSSIKNIGKRYNISSNPIKVLLEENNIPIINKTQFDKIYTLNEEFFKEIDTEEKAYFLGLLYSDGYVNSKKNTVGLCLQEQDKKIIEDFNKIIKSDRNLYVKNPPKKFPHRKKLVELKITNKNFYKHLENKGCVNKKSLVLTFPKEDILSKNLYSHFIRGYFDGDGSVYKSDGKYSFELIGTKELIEKAQEILIEELNLNKTSVYFKKGAKNTCRIRYSGNRQCIKIKDWLYKDATIFLERKNTKFNEIIASV